MYKNNYSKEKNNKHTNIRSNKEIIKDKRDSIQPRKYNKNEKELKRAERMMTKIFLYK